MCVLQHVVVDSVMYIGGVLSCVHAQGSQSVNRIVDSLCAHVPVLEQGVCHWW